MAQSISDVFARGEHANGRGRRTARFLGPADGGAQEDDGAPNPEEQSGGGVTERVAAFRPAESVALRRDVVEAFAAAILSDGEWVVDEGAPHLLAAARAAEALGDFEMAFQKIRAFDKKGGQWSWEDGFLKRRILRGVQADDLLSRSLKSAGDLRDAPAWAGLYAGLERAHLGWTRGDDPIRVRRRCERAIRTMSNGANLDPFAGLWAMQMRCDSSLESGDVKGAMEALDEAIAIPEIIVEIRQALEARRALWMYVYGYQDKARGLLDEIAGRGSLPGDLDDLLVHLCFEADDRERAFSVLRSTARDSSRLKSHALPLVMLHDAANDNPTTVGDVLREATEESDDWTLLRMRENFLDITNDQEGRGAGTELIDVLNRRLEGPLSVDERVNTLTRLGRLYEVEASLEEAAAEVYREALSFDPQHVPALRALGRLYTRRENWRGLAELYEREIATLSARPGAWRRHFQLAELYEHRLERDERALENYLVVLEERPNYLPALKSSARILGRLGRWTRLADLFLRMVDSAPSRRQKLYLLDKVAEVAENCLENYDVAIGAWREILELDPENPRVYTALGRLFSRTGRWKDLIELNESELSLIDDDEEVAAVLLRNAEIAEQNLEDMELAEQFYRRTLNVIPDYLPALEALGRIYLRGSRWADIVNMTGRELRTVKDPKEATRQLGALAEILEVRLDRRPEAIAIYEELWDMEPGDSHVFASLSRLYRSEKSWTKLVALFETRLQQAPEPVEVSALQGQLAILAEWKTHRPAEAYRRYLAALQGEPTEIHWLGGVARTWKSAGMEAAQVADDLEDLLMHATGEKIRDRYFVIIARLRERAEGGPEASRAYRAHGATQSLENQTVLRLAMAAAGEREQLRDSRRAIAHHPLQRALVVDRSCAEASTREQLASERVFMPPAAQSWLDGELSPEVTLGLGKATSLTTDLIEILRGEELYKAEGPDVEEFCRLRLRALQARRMGDHHSYRRWTRLEIEAGRPAVVAARLLELARYVTNYNLAGEEELYTEACQAVFPELAIDDQPEEHTQIEIPTLTEIEYPVVSEKHLEMLYDALRSTERWTLLKRCMEAQVGRNGLEKEQRLEIFRELAELLRDKLDDYSGARDALVHCWQLSEDADFLRSIVLLAGAHGVRDDALRFQRKHFERISLSPDAAASKRMQSGIWLASLLLEGEAVEDLEGAIDCLEHLVESYPEADGVKRASRILARAHARAGNGRRAVEIFKDVLHFQVRGDEVEDWRLLVDIHRRQLSNPTGAYTRQWGIVRAFPSSQIDLDILIDLAGEAGELADCVDQLATLANATTDGGKIALVARAAEAADEELGHAEEAFRLFERVLDLSDDDDEKRVYYERRRAVCLARMAGREPRALEAFRGLIECEPFEPANYRGLETLFTRSNALDRLRITRQTLRMLGCTAEKNEAGGKVHPTRALAEGVAEAALVPQELGGGVLSVLQAVMPLAEKVWADALPQRKALDGRRVRSGEDHPFYTDLQAALLAFGVTKFRLHLGESGPEHPLVFSESTPVVWVHQNLLNDLAPAGYRFVAGYCAALVWSGFPELMALDGRQLWHLIEGVVYRQSGEGFSERVDVVSQEMAELVSSPFDSATRRRVLRAVEECDQNLMNCHCEAWGRQLERLAARSGLLLSGDLEAATSALLRLSGWSLSLSESATQRRLRNDDTVADLVNLAYSDEYLELRYRMGLAGRPSRLKV